MTPEQRILDGLPLVRLVARSVATSLPRHVDVAELEAAGAVGLVEAARRFDDTRGVPFEPFARRRIRGAMLDAARRRDFASRSLRRWGRAIEQSRVTLSHALGRSPSEHEVAEHLGIAPQKLSRLKARLLEANLLHLDTSTVEDEFTGTVPGGDGDPATELVERERRSLLIDAVAALPERLRKVVVATYLEGRPLAEMAADLGVTESRVSQLRTEALTWLRQALEPGSEPRKGRPDPRVVAWGTAVATSRNWKERLAA